ncbi:MAG: MoaD/ThiS family protein [Micromonosporaceae bacterium]|jgi:molybdopterin converting factor small subunit|nr:MoaD/ThiS family protein [Micromonosporaceae bacterium]
MSLTVRYFAGARAAAGTTEETLTLPAAASSLTDLLDELAARHGPQLAKVLAVASFLVDGAACRDRAAQLPDGATVDVLPPFAGG